MSYQHVFVEKYGQGPYTCNFCYDTIHVRGLSREALSIHHLDHDRNNEDPSNLVPAHRKCHNSFHAKQDHEQKVGIGDRETLANAQKLSREAQRRNRSGFFNPESGRKGGTASAKMQRSNRINRFDPVVQGERGAIGGKIGIRVTNAQRWECHDCGLVTSPGPLSLHQRAKNHRGKSKL
jgi:hypothetical protein